MPRDSGRGRATASSYTTRIGSAPPPYSPYPTTPPTQERSAYHGSDVYPDTHPHNDVSWTTPNERTPLNTRSHVSTRGYVGRSVQHPNQIASASTWIHRLIIALLIAGIVMQASLYYQHIAQFPPTAAERDIIRRAWELERSDHQQMLDAWERQLRDHDAEAARMRQKWDSERREHQQEQQRWERERKEWERKRKEEEERNDWRKDMAVLGNKLGLYWGPVFSRHCVAFGKREYVARLGFEPREACQSMPIEIGGRAVDSPQICQEAEWNEDLIAHWYVDGDQSCMPHWGRVYDKGCVAPGLHRWEARLWGLHHGENWENMCSTTPAEISGIYFGGATYCQNRGIFYGMVGMFHGVDLSCP